MNAAGLALLASVTASVVLVGCAGGDSKESVPTGEAESDIHPGLTFYIPSTVQSRCDPLADLSAFADPEPIAAAVCTTPEGAPPLEVTYLLLDGPSGAEQHYSAILADDAPEGEQYGTGNPVGECSAKHFEGEGAYLINGIQAGRVRCQTRISNYEIVWSDPSNAVVAIVEGNLDPDEVETLLAYWSDDLGPGAGMVKELPAFPGAGEATVEEPFPDASEAKLLAAVSPLIRDACVEEMADAYFPYAVSGIRCPLAESETAVVGYGLFESSDDLAVAYNAMFRQFAEPEGVKQGEGNCVEDATGESSYVNADGEERKGRVFCYQAEDSYGLVWTHDELLMLGWAYDSAGNGQRIRNFWTLYGGPCTDEEHDDALCGMRRD